MKFEVNFDAMKKAVMTIGKAVKKSSLEPALIKIETGNDTVCLSLNGTVSIKMEVPARINEAGTFVTAFSAINVIAIRKTGGGMLKVESLDEGSLVLKYKQAKTILSKNNTELQVFDIKPEYPSVEIPVAAMKQMMKETVFASDDNMDAELHALKMVIAKDVEGLMKFSLSACDRKTVAVRTGYAVENGSYTGESILLPEQLKTALDVLDGDEENMKVAFGDKKVFLSYNGTVVSFPEVSKQFPDIENLLASRKQCTFSVKLNREELLEALNTVIYLQNINQQVASNSSIEMTFSSAESTTTIKCTGITEYSEKLTAEIAGNMETPVYFSAALLKQVVSFYPNENIIIGGTKSKAPFWMCCGENDEYIYCVMPKNH